MMISNVASQFSQFDGETPEKREERLNQIAAKQALTKEELEQLDYVLQKMLLEARDYHGHRLQNSDNMIANVIGETIDNDDVMRKVGSSLLTDPATLARFVLYLDTVFRHENAYERLEIGAKPTAEQIYRASEPTRIELSDDSEPEYISEADED